MMMKKLGWIEGRVVRVIDNTRLAGVTVRATPFIAGASESAVTDQRGEYRLFVAPGVYDVEFLYDRARKIRKHIEVTAEKSTAVLVELRLRDMTSDPTPWCDEFRDDPMPVVCFP